MTGDPSEHETAPEAGAGVSGRDGPDWEGTRRGRGGVDRDKEGANEYLKEQRDTTSTGPLHWRLALVSLSDSSSKVKSTNTPHPPHCV